MAWAVVAVDGGAAWAPAASAAAADALRRTCRPLLRCWATARALGPPVPAAVAETPGSTRSGTTIGTAARGRAAAGRTAQKREQLRFAHISSHFVVVNSIKSNLFVANVVTLTVRRAYSVTFDVNIVIVKLRYAIIAMFCSCATTRDARVEKLQNRSAGLRIDITLAEISTSQTHERRIFIFLSLFLTTRTLLLLLCRGNRLLVYATSSSQKLRKSRFPQSEIVYE